MEKILNKLIYHFPTESKLERWNISDNKQINNDAMKIIGKYYENFLTRELAERSLIASWFEDKDMYENEWLKMLDERDWVEEDEFEWYFLINLCYASFVKWFNYSKNYWISHDLLCGCRKERMRVVYRYTNDELKEFLSNIKATILQIEN